MKRAALYVRVSTSEQKRSGISVESQIAALEEYCHHNNYSIQGLYNDAGISARKSYKRRPALLNMLNACQNGLVDVVLFTKLDRFFRNVKDYYACIDQMNDVPWCAIWEDYETETSSGVFKVNIMLSVAQSEADRDSERIKAVKQYQRSKGVYVGSAPIGYKHVKDTLIKDESCSEALDVFFDNFATTHSIVSAQRAAHDKGFTLNYSSAKHIIHSPAYTGKSYNAEFEPYITEEQFRSNIIELNRRTRTPSKPSRIYLFAGVMRCPKCGGRMTGKPAYRKAGTMSAYRCQHHQEKLGLCPEGFHIMEDRAEQILLDMLNDAIGDARVVAKSNRRYVDNTEKIKRLSAKLERLTELYEEGDISKDAYKEKRDAIKAEITMLSLDNDTEKIPEEMPEHWQDVYAELDSAHKKAFWRDIIESFTIDGEKLKVKFK